MVRKGLQSLFDLCNMVELVSVGIALVMHHLLHNMSTHLGEKAKCVCLSFLLNIS